MFLQLEIPGLHGPVDDAPSPWTASVTAEENDLVTIPRLTTQLDPTSGTISVENSSPRNPVEPETQNNTPITTRTTPRPDEHSNHYSLMHSDFPIDEYLIYLPILTRPNLQNTTLPT